MTRTDPMDESAPHGCCPACQQAWRQHRSVDKLTGLPDRWSWDEQAEQAIDQAQEHREPVALLLVDLDHFKPINDEYGHPAGDAVLAALAGVLQSALRSESILGRYGGHGGDEFLALLPRTTAHQAKCALDRLHDEIQRFAVTVPTTSGEHVPLTGITASIGLATHSHEDNYTVADLVLTADGALQRAKGDRRRDPGQTPDKHSVTAGDRTTCLRHLLTFAQMLGGQWHPDILMALADGPCRYSELLAKVRSTTVSDRCLQSSVLNRTLRRLERDDLIRRVEEPGIWPRTVRYFLTPSAHDLLTTLASGLVQSQPSESSGTQHAG